MSFPSEFLEDKYEVLFKIREGGMGEIYKVRHRLLEEDRVVKLIRPQHAEDEDLQRRFEHEARTTIRLRHPGIAQVFDFAVAPDSTAVIVMEFIDGFSLLDLLARGLPELGLVVEIAEQSLKALGFLHQQGYIHRDISPDNVMLTRGFDGKPLVKLIDLGIAKRLEHSSMKTATGMFLGKARYSAPEQFGEGEVGPASDIYSFGIMLYELLTGVRPIVGEELSQLIGGHLFQRPLEFSETDVAGRVPQKLREIILRTLEKDTTKRIGSAEELSRLLVPFRQPFRSPFEEEEAAAPKPAGAVPAGGAASGGAAVVTWTERTLASGRGGGPRWRALAIVAAVLLAVGLALGLGWHLARSEVARSEAPVAGPQLVADPYRTGLLKLEAEAWGEAADHLGEAVVSGTEAALAAGGTGEPVLPHYFLGVAHFELRNYVVALQDWKAAEELGVVQKTPFYADLRERRERVAVLLRENIERAAGDVELGGDVATLLEEMATDVEMDVIWDVFPDLKESVEAALEDFRRVRDQVAAFESTAFDLTDPEVATALVNARSAAHTVRKELADLSVRIDERLEAVMDTEPE